MAARLCTDKDVEAAAAKEEIDLSHRILHIDLMKYASPLWLRFAVVAVAASAVGFAVHVMDQSIVPAWVQRQMRGVASAGPPGGATFIFAALSSIEIGAALCILYALLRRVIPNFGTFSRGLVLGILSLAIHGDLFRQPFMNAIIGNPLRVVLAMAVGPWLTSILMSVTLAVVYEWLVGPPVRAREPE